MERNDSQVSYATTSIISGLFYLLADITLFPFDTISTRLKGYKGHLQTNTARYAWESLQREGKGLYRGLSITILQSFVPTVMYVYLYEYLLNKVSRSIDQLTDKKQIKLATPFFVSAIAKAIPLILQLPFDTLRTRIQINSQQYQYASLREGLRQIRQKQGIHRFYKSTKIFYSTKIIYTALSFQFYELFNYFLPHHPPISAILNSAMAAFLATTFVNPLEVIITRYALVDTTKKKLVFSHMLRKIHGKQGLKGFYKGYPTEVFINCFYAVVWMPIFQFMRSEYDLNILE